MWNITGRNEGVIKMICIDATECIVKILNGISNSCIHLGINYKVSNEMNRDEKWPNTKDFRLVNYSFNTRNICSKIGQIVTDLWWIFNN